MEPCGTPPPLSLCMIGIKKITVFQIIHPSIQFFLTFDHGKKKILSHRKCWYFNENILGEKKTTFFCPSLKIQISPRPPQKTFKSVIFKKFQLLKT